MGKKTSSRIIAALSPTLRWEAVSLNDNYIRFYRKGLAYRKSPNYSKEVENMACYIGWSLCGLADPGKSYKENAKLLKEELFLPKPVLLMPTSTKLKDKLEATVTIDLNFPNRTILWSVENQLSYYLTLYKKSLKMNRGKKIKESRVNISRTKRCLEICRLAKKGWGVDQLARKYCVEDVEKGRLSYARMKIKRDLKRGNDIIEYGFQQLR